MKAHRDLLLWMILVALAAVAPTGAQESDPAAATNEAEATVESARLIARIDGLQAEIAELDPTIESTTGEIRNIFRHRIKAKRLALLDAAGELARWVVDQEAQGREVIAEREKAESAVIGLTRTIYEATAEMDEAFIDMLKDPATLSAAERDVIERRAVMGSRRMTLIYRGLQTSVDLLALLGLDTTEARGFLTERLNNRAENLTARTELAIDEAKLLKERLAKDPANAELQAQVLASEIRLEDTTNVLKSTIELMQQAGLETAPFQTVVIESSGQITTDILDTKVAASLFKQWLADTKKWAALNLPAWFMRILAFLLIVFLARVAARLVARGVERAVRASKFNLSQLLQRMIVTTASQTVWILGLLLALAQLGISLGPLLAGLGIAGFIVGFALQDTLANFAAGMMILLYRPYDVGDLIEAGGGVFGKVHKMSLVSTTILTIDNQTLILPNGKIWGDVIKNVTAQTQRRVDMTFGISYNDDIPKAEKIFHAILADHPKVLDDPEPMVKLHKLNDSSVDFVVRPWVETDDYWDVYWDVTREVKIRLDAEGVTIPFPQRDVHLHRAGNETTAEPAA